jgi:hypothetical protein
MTLQQKQRTIAPDISLVYDLSTKPNPTKLTPKLDRAVIAKLKVDLLLPTDKVMSVDIDFDTDSGYHNNSIMVMDDFGVEMLSLAFEVKYGKETADNIRSAWQQKEYESDPRKPSYILVQAPTTENESGKVFAVCGKELHPTKTTPNSIV